MVTRYALLLYIVSIFVRLLSSVSNFFASWNFQRGKMNNFTDTNRMWEKLNNSNTPKTEANWAEQDTILVSSPSRGVLKQWLHITREQKQILHCIILFCEFQRITVSTLYVIYLYIYSLWWDPLLKGLPYATNRWQSNKQAYHMWYYNILR